MDTKKKMNIKHKTNQQNKNNNKTSGMLKNYSSLYWRGPTGTCFIVRATFSTFQPFSKFASFKEQKHRIVLRVKVAPGLRHDHRLSSPIDNTGHVVFSHCLLWVQDMLIAHRRHVSSLHSNIQPREKTLLPATFYFLFSKLWVVAAYTQTQLGCRHQRIHTQKRSICQRINSPVTQKFKF